MVAISAQAQNTPELEGNVVSGAVLRGLLASVTQPSALAFAAFGAAGLILVMQRYK